jgi:methylated-DNA-protein-cysteine methyltransferase related protein
VTVFQEAVLYIVRLIPNGKVASYGQVAAYIGAPRGARQVGWAMRSLEGTPDFPWWRVLNNSGTITIKGNFHSDALVQKKHLESEGIAVGDDFKIDITAHRFQPTAKQLTGLKLEPGYLQKVLDKYTAK